MKRSIIIFIAALAILTMFSSVFVALYLYTEFKDIVSGSPHSVLGENSEVIFIKGDVFAISGSRYVRIQLAEKLFPILFFSSAGLILLGRIFSKYYNRR